MKSITVCHVATLTRWGGVERMLIDLLQQRNNRQVRHLLVTTSIQEEQQRAVEAAGIPWFQPSKYMRYDPSAFRQIATWMQTNHVQLVHSYNAYANSWAYLATRFRNSPMLLTGEHGTVWSARSAIRWLDCRAQRSAMYNIANSNASARLLELRYGVNPTKIRVVYNAVPPFPAVSMPDARTTLGIPEDSVVVGSVGRLDTPKDFSTFIEAAAFVRRMRDDVVFVLVGGGPQEAELRTLISLHNLNANFILAGWREDARTLLQSFDIFVSTSIRESFGNALVEAAMCGKPVIASAVDGVPEVVQNGVTGILLSPSQPVKLSRSQGVTALPRFVLRDNMLQPPRSLDPQQLANEILALLDNEEMRLQLGANAKKWGQSAFSFKRYSSELEQIYLDAVEFSQCGGR